jgi:hypothetical protein
MPFLPHTLFRWKILKEEWLRDGEFQKLVRVFECPHCQDTWVVVTSMNPEKAIIVKPTRSYTTSAVEQTFQAWANKP